MFSNAVNGNKQRSKKENKQNDSKSTKMAFLEGREGKNFLFFTLHRIA